MRLLLLDEVARVRAERAAVLSQLGFEVTQADAYGPAQASPSPHVVLLAHRGSRDALSRELRALEESALSAVPVIVMGSGLGHAITAMSAGADDFWDEAMDEASFRYAAHALAASRVPALAPWPERPLAVLADDDALFRERTRDELREAGFEVAAVGSGAELLHLLERAPRPAVVVMDFYMPGIGGQELLRRLKDNPRWAVVPVVVVSGMRADTAFVSDVLRLGARAFVEKTARGLTRLAAVVKDQVSPDLLSRRRAPRATSFGLAQFRRAPEEPWLTAFVHNLGPSGAYLRTTVAPPKDSTVHVRLEVPQGETRVVAVARVAWSRTLASRGEAPYGMGLQFADLSAEAQTALEDAVTLHGGAQAMKPAAVNAA